MKTFPHTQNLAKRLCDNDSKLGPDYISGIDAAVLEATEAVLVRLTKVQIDNWFGSDPGTEEVKSLSNDDVRVLNEFAEWY